MKSKLIITCAALAAVAICSLISVHAQAPARGGRGATGGSGRDARAPGIPTKPLDLNDHEGWQSMFDGVSLKGWDGPDVWMVENGEIVVASTAAHPNGSVYLIWKGGEPKNFEFKTDLLLEGAGANSGIQFRAVLLGPLAEKKNSQWESRGYQADYTYNNGSMGNLIECSRGPNRGVPPRPDAARRGQMVRAGLTVADAATIVGTVGDPGALKSFAPEGEWNQIHIMAQGDTLMYLVNGHLMSVYFEQNHTIAADHGVLALQLEGGGDIKAYFRNLWLKTLP